MSEDAATFARRLRQQFPAITDEAAMRAAMRMAGVHESDMPPRACHEPPALIFPIRFTLPWSALCSDNDKYGARLVSGSDGRPHPRLILSERYRAAKATTRKIARQATAGADPVTVPLEITALVYVPDGRPHDVVNFAKCAHDGLETAIYQNDRWLYRAHWIRAGVDVDGPRAEITIDRIPDAA